MRSSPVTTGSDTAASQYNNLRDDAYAASMLLTHQQSTPNLTFYVEAGVAYVGATRVIFAGGNTPAFTAPIANPRIDLVTIDNTGTIAIVQGTENASPVAPAYPAGKLVLCEVYNVVGETALYDAEQTGEGYIYNDVRPILGGAYIASSAQVAAGAIDGSNLSGLGDISSGAGTIPKANLPQLASPKFGGSGVDGVLDVTSGTTTINLGAADIVIKNYISINVASGATLNFSNPAPNGTIIILKSQGDVTIAGTIDASGMGAAAGSGGTAPNNGTSGNNGIAIEDTAVHYGVYGWGEDDTNAAVGGLAVGPSSSVYTLTAWSVSRKAIVLAPGSGGGGAGGAQNAGTAGNGGAGGNGGGALYMECAGSLNFTGTVSVAGQNGADGTNGGGGGGGGSTGMAVILYNSLTANTGTINSAGGNGGRGNQTTANAGGGGGAGAGSFYGAGGTGGKGGNNSNHSTAGGNGGGNGAGAGGGGGDSSAIGSGSLGGTGGSSSGGLVAPNTEFV